ncbi:MAG: diguanylate cyclase [Campylobacterota bacterium]
MAQTQDEVPCSASDIELIKILRQYVIFSITDVQGRITDVSDAFCSHTGYTKKELIGKRHNILRSKSTEVSFYRNMWSTINDGRNWFGEVQNLKKDGTPFWIKYTITPLFDKENRKIGYLAIYNNITREKKIEEASYIDELTQIYNRKKFNSTLDLFFQDRAAYAGTTALVMIDIDHFKAINDLYGHIIGDEILILLSRFINTHIRKSDLLCRWGGEEFVLLLSEITHDEAFNFCEKLRKNIASMPCETLKKYIGVDKHITCSFGVSMLRENDSPKSLTERADKALYSAKENGRNRVEFL